MLYVDVHAMCVSGTNKGGEDLFLVFETTTKERPNFKKPLGFVVSMSETGNYGCIATQIGNEDIIRAIKYKTNSYEFTWEGNEDDLIKLVEKELKNKNNWSRPFDEETFKFKWEKFIDGNAD